MHALLVNLCKLRRGPVVDPAADCGCVHCWRLVREGFYIVQVTGVCCAAACCYAALHKRWKLAFVLLQVLAGGRGAAMSCKTECNQSVSWFAELPANLV